MSANNENDIIKPIAMIPVISSLITYYGYDYKNKILFITFLQGATYKYLDVPLNTYNEFKENASVGKYFLSQIKNKYKCLNITDGHN